MNFDLKEHNKLTKNIEQIFIYLHDNVVPQLCHNVTSVFESENGDISLTIYAKNEVCFKINIRNCVYTIPTLNKWFSEEFLSEPNPNNFRKIRFNLFESDDMMYAFIEHWEWIKDKCENAMKEDREMIHKINNFKI